MATTTRLEEGAGGRPAWARRYVAIAIGGDAAAALVAALGSRAVRFGWASAELAQGHVSLPYTVVALLMAPLWVAAMAVNGAYEQRQLGNGSEEYRRIVNGAVRTLAIVSFIAFAARLPLARSFVALVLPAAMVLSVVSRHIIRKRVHALRAEGAWTNKVVVVGSVGDVTDLVRHLQRARWAGLDVIGVCVPDLLDVLDVEGATIPVLGDPTDVVKAAFAAKADAVAVAGSSTIGSRALRDLGWELEGTGVDLVVAPSLTAVAGPRIVTRPVAGLPLLHVEEPELSGAVRVARDVVDRAIAIALLPVVAPIVGVAALAVRFASKGPAFFKQVRVGRDGEEFVIWKLRTMTKDAERELTVLAEQNDHDGVLFKIHNDPRRTPVGRFLRRYSIDELPQVWNVVRGDMSLIGPRPPLPSEVARYSDDVRRRLLVKPGLTGLWQVSGRADLPWSEAARLDVYYVDNWSPALDALILWKTVRAVLSGRGAY